MVKRDGARAADATAPRRAARAADGAVPRGAAGATDAAFRKAAAAAADSAGADGIVDGSATLTDLRKEDKLKIGNLLRELAQAQRDGQDASKERSQFNSRLQHLRSHNEHIIQETVVLRGKFRHSLQLLKTYQQRIGEMEAQAQSDIAPPPEAGGESAATQHGLGTIAEEPAQPTAQEESAGGARREASADPDRAEARAEARTEARTGGRLQSLRERFPLAAAAYSVMNPERKMKKPTGTKPRSRIRALSPRGRYAQCPWRIHRHASARSPSTWWRRGGAIASGFCF